MLIDYLRYVAFEGRLRSFFEGNISNYAERSATTGAHLRFDPVDMEKRIGYWNMPSSRQRNSDEYAAQEDAIDELKRLMGISGGPDNLASSPFDLDERPSAFSYTDTSPPPLLQIIIDIAPGQWGPEYSARRTYEGTQIIYRRSGAAKGHFQSGERIFDESFGASRYGSLCGFFKDPKGSVFALTCGHVAGTSARVSVDRSFRVWRLPLWRSEKRLGRVSFMTLPERLSYTARNQLDAALIELSPSRIRPKGRNLSASIIKPISTMLQEERVRFRGSGRGSDTLARIAAVTVRKSIDLLRDDVLRDVGDVLMLGHRVPMYISQRVSRGGDSGAAVRSDPDPFGAASDAHEWHGMIIGSDDAGAYATFSEHLWAWTSDVLRDADLEFSFDL